MRVLNKNSSIELVIEKLNVKLLYIYKFCCCFISLYSWRCLQFDSPNAFIHLRGFFPYKILSSLQDISNPDRPISFQVNFLSILGGETPSKLTFNCVKRLAGSTVLSNLNWDGSCGNEKFPAAIADVIFRKFIVIILFFCFPTHCRP